MVTGSCLCGTVQIVADDLVNRAGMEGAALLDAADADTAPQQAEAGQERVVRL